MNEEGEWEREKKRGCQECKGDPARWSESEGGEMEDGRWGDEDVVRGRGRGRFLGRGREGGPWFVGTKEKLLALGASGAVS